MNDNWKILAQVSPAAASETLFYTVPISSQTLLETLNVCNRDNMAATFRLRIAKVNAALSPEQWVFYDLTLQPNDTYVAMMHKRLAAKDAVYVTSSNGLVSFGAFGIEQFV